MKPIVLIALLAGSAVAQTSPAGAPTSDAAMEARQRVDCAVAKHAGSRPDLPRPRGYMNSEAVDYDNPSYEYSPCSDAEYIEYKSLFDPARMLRESPSAAGSSPAQERALVIRELQRARQAGELNWADQELGLPMKMAR
jgi:hypothetical protein